MVDKHPKVVPSEPILRTSIRGRSSSMRRDIPARAALTWYNDTVDGSDHQEDAWSFKTVVTGLYHRFIHNVATRAAVDSFKNAEYDSRDMVVTFYHELVRHAMRMVRPPERYTFKRQFMARMPEDILYYLISKEVTAEHSNMETILHHTRKAK